MVINLRHHLKSNILKEEKKGGLGGLPAQQNNFTTIYCQSLKCTSTMHNTTFYVSVLSN